MWVRRRRDRARAAGTAEGREVRALAHAVAVRAADRPHEGDLGRGPAEHRDGDGVAVPVARLVVVDQVRRPRRVAHQVGRDEDLDAVLLHVGRAFGVGARDEDAPVLQQDRLRVVQTVDGRVGQPGEARVERRLGVVEQGVVVGFAGEPEPSEALLCAVEDQVGSVGHGGHAGDDAFGGL